MNPSKQTPPDGDFGPKPFVTHLAGATKENGCYRRTLWTGCNLQLTLMCIPPCGEVGLEVHPDHDQFLYLEQGRGTVQMGTCKEHLSCPQSVCCGDAIFVPAGTWHNLCNADRVPLKLYAIYAPPHHPHGTVHRTKAESDARGD